MILVTGGAGFFGEAIVRALLQRGEKVRVFDLNRLEGCKDVDCVQGDIRDRDAVRSACEGVSVVHHNVAQVPLAKDKQLFRSVNRDGTRTLLEAALRAGVRKVVYTSSSAIFGVPKSNPVTEETTPTPAEEYGQAKWEGEIACKSFVERGLDVSIVRPRTILGHGRLGVFQILFEWVIKGYNVPVFGAGDNVYQFIHADDLAEACIRAGATEGAETFNLGAERFGTMRELLQTLCDHAKTGSRVRSLPMRPLEIGMTVTSALGLSPLGPYHALMYGRSMFFDIGRAKERLDWTPRYSNAEMIVESYDWYLANRNQVLANTTTSAHRSKVKQGVLGLVKHLL